MENFKIEKTKSTPSVYFNNKGILILSGVSYPEHADDFYTPLLKKMNEYTEENKNLSLTIEMEYINTSSSKYILELMKIILDKDVNLNIIWCYEEDDEDMEELGMYYEEFLDVKFEFRKMKSNYL